MSEPGVSRKLMLGSAGWRAPGWTTIDANPTSGADYITTLPPLPDEALAERWEVIQALHFIEHLPLWKALELVRQCHEALLPGGVLILEQPDISYCARVLLGQIQPPRGAVGQFDMWGLYGDPTHGDELMLHRWGYTPRSLTDLLVEGGFERDRIRIADAVYHQPVRDFRIEGVRE